MSKQKHMWTDEEKAIIRRDYRHNEKSLRELARRFGVSRFAMRDIIQTLGIAYRKAGKPWTPEEEEELRGMIHRYRVDTISKKMGRSVSSIVSRSKCLGLHRRFREGWYTKIEVAEILAVDHKKVQRWIDNGLLVATHHYGHSPGYNGSACWHIERDDLRRFIMRYPMELTGYNVDMVQVVDILVGLEVPPDYREKS